MSVIKLPALQLLLFAFLMLCFTGSHQLWAQGETNIWYFGRNAGADFNPGAPVAIFNGALNTSEGCATLCRPDGTLMMYTDGIRVWNRNHAIMQNGNGLRGDPSSTQSGIIVPRPGNPDIFYIFTVDMQAGQALFAGGDADGQSSGVRYTEVNMAANGGLGAVNNAVKNVPLLNVSTEGLTAVVHANGIDYWVVVHGWNNNRYHAYRVTAAGVDANAVISNTGPTVNGGPSGVGSIGYMKISPDGTKIAAAHGYGLRSVVLSDFNDATGVVSNSINMSVAANSNSDGPYGVEFSQCSEYLYVTEQLTNFGFYYDSPRETRIYRYDLQAGNIPGSRTTLATVNFEWVGALQLASDGNIYCASVRRQFDAGLGDYYGTANRYIHRINNPREVGATFTLNAVDLQPRLSVFGLPPFLSSYFNDIDFSAVSNISSDTIFCIGDSTLFEAQVVFYDSIRWYFGDPASGPANNTSTLLSPKHFYSAPGTYEVTLIKYLCNKSDTAYKTVNIRPRPEFDIRDTTGCTGINLTLTAPIAGATYQWSTGASTQSANINGPGNYSLQITQNECSYTDNFNISFFALPTVGITPSGPLQFCEPNSVNLVGTAGLNSYQWSLNGNVIPGANTPSLNADASGSYSLLVTDDNCENTTSVTVTVNPVPVITLAPSGPIDICAGQGSTLTISPGNLINIRWFRDGNLINGANGNTFNADIAGIYSVRAESASNCEGLSNSVQVNVNPLPDLQITPSGPVNICTGDNAVLTLNPSGLQNIQWSRDGQAIGGATNSTLTVTTAGTYTAVGESAAGCPGASNAVVLNVLNQFSIDISASAAGFCPSEDVTLSINTPGVLNIQWSLDGQPINGANGTTLQATAGGTYSVTGENANGCPGVSNNIVITAYATPSISITPSGNSTICDGEDISLSLSTSGLQNIQWFRDGQAVGGATGTSISVNQAGTYTLTAESSEGCAATSNEAIIIVAPLPDLQITPTGPVNICTGDNAVLTLNPSGLQNIQWSRDGQAIGGATNSSLTVTTAGTYTAVGESAAGCPGTSNAVVVNVNSSFSIDISPSSPLSFCENSSAVLTIGNSGINNIVWSRNGSVIPNANATTLTVSQAGTYSATALSPSGCPGTSNEVVVTVDPLPLVSITTPGSLSFCEGASIPLEAQVSGANPASYLWTLNGSPFDDAPVINVQQGGTYVLSVVSDQGCPGNQASVVVTVSPIPVVDLGPDRDVCEGVTVLLDASTPGASYVWSTGESSSLIQIGQAGNYSVVVSVNGCSGSDDINISIQPAPQLELGNAFSICRGEEAVLDVSSANADTYLWNDGSTLATLNISEPGLYSVTATIGDCQASESITVGLTAEPPTLSLGVNRELCIGDTILLQAQGSDILSYVWSDGSTASSLAVTASGVYSLVVTGACGEAEDQVEVVAVDCGCFVAVPSAFTPNGDGLNDILRPLSPCEVEGVVFMVFNRWGEKVFESTDINSGWNGVFRNQDQPHDAYIYYLSYLDNRSAEKKEYRGSVLLIR